MSIPPACTTIQVAQSALQTIEQQLKMLQQTNAACWLLRSAPAEVQRWFAERYIPTILAGITMRESGCPRSTLISVRFVVSF